MFKFLFKKKEGNKPVPKKHTHYRIHLLIEGVRYQTTLHSKNSGEHNAKINKLRACIQEARMFREEIKDGAYEIPFPRKISLIEEQWEDCDSKYCERSFHA